MSIIHFWMMMMIKYLKENRITIISVSVAIVFVVLILRFILFLGFVPSESMEPTLKVGNVIIGVRNVQAYNNDIVVFKKDGKLLIKRICASYGDTVDYRDGQVFINENAVGGYNGNENKTLPVPQNEHYLLGDNRNNSKDSRYWENPFVSDDDIVAKMGWVVNIN